MQYSLGNMLKGGGALNPDGLALDLALALDRSFTTDPAAAGNALITSRRGPAAKFSRGTGATQVNAAGLIEYAPENLIATSVPGTNWTSGTGAHTVTQNSTDVGFAPDGSLPTKVVCTASGNYQISFTAVTGTQYTASIYARVLSGTDTIRVGGIVVGSFTASTATDEWARYSDTNTSATTGSRFLQVNMQAGETLYLWGAQVERASTARTYYPTTTAAFYGPRFDHDPVTGVCKGLLREESRTNSLRESQALDNSTFWIGAGATVAVTPNNQISPDGLQNAETLTIASSVAGGIYQSVTCTANTVYTFSFYVKLGTFLASNFLIAVRDDVGNAFIAENVVPSVTPVTSEWRRITYTFTTPTNCTTVRPYVYRNNAPTASGTVFIWGAQLEVGGEATSYIPTTTSAAVRSADVCSIEGDNFTSFYNQSEGTLSVEVYSESKSSATGSPSFFSVSDGTVDNALAIIRSSASDNAAAPVNSSGAAQFNSNIITNAFQSGGLKKLALAYKTNDLAFSAIGSSPLLDTLATIPANLTIAAIGSWPANSRHANGHIARIQYFRKRLSNAKLQNLTAP